MAAKINYQKNQVDIQKEGYENLEKERDAILKEFQELEKLKKEYKKFDEKVKNQQAKIAGSNKFSRDYSSSVQILRNLESHRVTIYNQKSQKIKIYNKAYDKYMAKGNIETLKSIMEESQSELDELTRAENEIEQKIVPFKESL